MKTTRFLLASAAILLVTGCATHKRAVQNYRPLDPLVQVIPPQGKEEPRVAENPAKPEPIYSNPIIEEVEMAPYVNDEGNLVFPGKVLVIRQPGHWNLSAAQKNRQYFVPAENQPPQLAPPSKSYYDYIQSKKNGIPDTTLDVSRARVLGYAQNEELHGCEPSSPSHTPQLRQSCPRSWISGVVPRSPCLAGDFARARERYGRCHAPFRTEIPDSRPIVPARDRTRGIRGQDALRAEVSRPLSG